MLALFVALQEEENCLLPLLAQKQRQRLEGFPLTISKACPEGSRRGGPQTVLLCRTGPGQQAGKAAHAVLSHYPPPWPGPDGPPSGGRQAVLSLGFAGALQEDLHTGDLIFCESLYLHQDGEGHPHPPPRGRGDPDQSGQGTRGKVPCLHADKALLARAEMAAQNSGLPYKQGPSATVSRVLRTVEKRTFGLKQPAHIVEMESFWVGQIAQQHGIPFLALRAVVDEIDDWMPEVSLVDKGGVVLRRKVLAYLAQHPERAPALMHLGANARKAATSLAAAVLALLEDWGEE